MQATLANLLAEGAAHELTDDVGPGGLRERQSARDAWVHFHDPAVPVVVEEALHVHRALQLQVGHGRGRELEHVRVLERRALGADPGFRLQPPARNRTGDRTAPVDQHVDRELTTGATRLHDRVLDPAQRRSEVARLAHRVHVARTAPKARLDDPGAGNIHRVVGPRSVGRGDAASAQRLCEGPLVDARLDARTRRQPNRRTGVGELVFAPRDRKHLFGDRADDDARLVLAHRVAQRAEESRIAGRRHDELFGREREARAEFVGIGGDNSVAPMHEGSNDGHPGRAARTGDENRRPQRRIGLIGRGLRVFALGPARAAHVGKASDRGTEALHLFALLVEDVGGPHAQRRYAGRTRGFPLPPGNRERDRRAYIGIRFVLRVGEQNFGDAVQTKLHERVDRQLAQLGGRDLRARDTTLRSADCGARPPHERGANGDQSRQYHYQSNDQVTIHEHPPRVVCCSEGA